MDTIRNKVYRRLIDYLQEEDIFLPLLFLFKKMGTINVFVENKDKVIHVTHFEQGKIIRDWMKEQKELKEFGNEWIFDSWAILTDNAIINFMKEQDDLLSEKR